jgi:hypothetical protein
MNRYRAGLRLMHSPKFSATQKLSPLVFVLFICLNAHGLGAFEFPFFKPQPSGNNSITSVDLDVRVKNKIVYCSMILHIDVVDRQASLEVLQLSGGGNPVPYVKNKAKPKPTEISDPVLESTSGDADISLKDNRCYASNFSKRGACVVTLNYLLPAIPPGGVLPQVQLYFPPSEHRTLLWHSEVANMETQLQGVFRRQVETEGQGTLLKALVLPNVHWVKLAWTPKLEQDSNEVVRYCESNTIVTVLSGVTRLDQLFHYTISQGAPQTTSFSVPQGWHVTKVDGGNVRSWKTDRVGEEDIMTVTHNQAPKENYQLRVMAEKGIPMLPTKLSIEPLVPRQCQRSSGYLCVGTDRSIALSLDETTSMTQVDATRFPIWKNNQELRPIPTRKLFCFHHFEVSPSLSIGLKEIIPVLEVMSTQVLTVDEENMRTTATLNITVKDAPLDEIEVWIDAQLSLVRLEGTYLKEDNYRLGELSKDGQRRSLFIVPSQPYSGQVRVQLSLETGRSPLGAKSSEWNVIQIKNAKIQQGFVAVSVSKGLDLEQLKEEGLQVIHGSSFPERVPALTKSYRFRTVPCTLSFVAVKFPPRLHAEAFHLTSLGEGISYGSVALNYLVMDSSISSLRFSIPAQYENIEFVGADVSHWNREGDEWLVHLSRKVRGAYSLAIVYSERYESGGNVMFGGVVCKDVDSLTGSIVVASQLNLRLQSVSGGQGLIPLGQDEIPNYYLLLVDSPILESYKFSRQAGPLVQSVDLYERGQLLPVIVEHADFKTTLSIGPDNSMQSLTHIRAVVKNVQSQYLSFALPPTARLGTVELTENEGGKSRKITSSIDRGRLNIPLPRKRDPNNACVVELEYGLVHSGQPSEVHVLQAPECNAMITQIDWQIVAPRDWALISQSDTPRSGGFSLGLLQRWVQTWQKTLKIIFSDSGWLFICVAALLVLALTLCTKVYGWSPKLLKVTILLLCCGLGLLLATQTNFEPFQVSTILAQMQGSVHLKAPQAEAVKIGFSAVPAWQSTWARGAWQWPLCLTLLGVAMLRARSLRLAGKILGLTGVMGFLLTFEVGARVMLHFMSWGCPIALITFYVLNNFNKSNMSVSAVSMALWLMFSPLQVRAEEVRAEEVMLSKPILMKELQAQVSIGEDSAQLTLQLKLNGLAKGRYPLMSSAALLQAQQDFGREVRVEREGQTYVLILEREMDRNVSIRFDVPLRLAHAGERSRGSLRLGLPAALVRKVQVQVAQAALDLNVGDDVVVTHRQSELTLERLEAILPAQGDFELRWEPRQRDRSIEKARYHARVVSAYRIEDGVMEGEHRITLTMVTGELSRCSFALPASLSVYNVTGAGCSAWRYDAVTHILLAQFQPAIGTSVELTLSTQSSSLALPWDLSISPPWVPEAETNSLFASILHDDHLQVSVVNQPQRMALEDFLALEDQGQKKGKEQPRLTFRHSDSKDAIQLRIVRVEPEIVVREEGSLSISDEHIRYNGELFLSITRAGVFHIDLEWPMGYDIESLTCPEASHWDEVSSSPVRKVRVYFRNRLLGDSTLKFLLTHSPDDEKGIVEKPVIRIINAERHRGTVEVSAEKGLRLTVQDRRGVSEMKKKALLPGSISESISFKLLAPDHLIRLHVETLLPRLEVSSLHVAHVNENTVRHQHTLIYDIQNAGVKIFTLRLPEGVESLVLEGPYLAKTSRDPENNNVWILELNRKCLDEKYKLSVQYETRYDKDEDPRLSEVIPLGIDLWKAYISVHRSGRIELSPVTIPLGMRSFDSRSIPTEFSNASLADAALCYFAVDPKEALVVNVRRHEEARTFQAKIEKTRLESFLSVEGELLTILEMDLVVGAKRNLTVWLPRTAKVWSLQVSGRCVVPAILAGEGPEQAYLIPLDYAVGDEAKCSISLTTLDTQAPLGSSGQHHLQGPRFDLPLSDCRWTLYCPEDFNYTAFGGSVVLDESATMLHSTPLSGQDPYLALVQKVEKAKEYQQMSSIFAENGQQVQARKALEAAFNYSQSDVALNEDTRVQLHRLKRQQAVMGLVGARDALRHRGGKEELALVPSKMSLSNFNMQQAEQIQNNLDINDSRNLEKISLRMLEVQRSADTAPVQLDIKLPRRGTRFEFYSSMNIDESAPLSIGFSSDQAWLPHLNLDYRLLALLLGYSLVMVWVMRARSVPAHAME